VKHVAMLRGVNLARSRRLSMGDLRAALEDAGYEDVRTHLQSGNVVLSSPVSAAKLGPALERQIADAFGLETDVIVRSHKQLAAIVERDPFAGVATNPSTYVVTFLASKPPAAAVKRLRELDDEFAVHGREIYSWHPNGVHGSKLAAALTPGKLGVVATARNWNTVRKLLELSAP
jgi:uncharacterized protein (DUF1697 family)